MSVTDIFYFREDSRALEDIVQCGICLEKLTDPRMLPCQHTFCLSCLQTHFIAKNLVMKPNPQQNNTRLQFADNEDSVIICSLCQTQYDLPKGYESLEGMPKNLYMESLLKILDSDISPGSSSPKQPDFRCVNCKTVSENQEHVCQHCMQVRYKYIHVKWQIKNYRLRFNSTTDNNELF